MKNDKENIASLSEVEEILGTSLETTVNKKVKPPKPAKPPKPPKVKKEKQPSTTEPNYVTFKVFYISIIIFSLLGGVAGALSTFALNTVYGANQNSQTTPVAETVEGLSAYEIAVKNGFDGSEQQWLNSLQGKQGAPGIVGPRGEQGLQGEPGEKGEKGEPGEDANIENLNSIPGWPSNCSNPRMTQIEIFDEENVGKFYNILTCN